MNVGIHNITPNEAINRMLHRYVIGSMDWPEVERWIVAGARSGILHPDTSVDTIRRVTVQLYGDRVTRDLS